MRVVSVVGARPQFVKAFPTSLALREDHEELLVHTGQHYDAGLSEVFFEELGIPDPDYHLGVGSDTHARQTADALSGIDEVLETERPDAVLVYGDTNSTLSGALAATKREPLLVHVEAGLRSGDSGMPEEVNRVLTDHCSDVLCAPSETAVQDLASEGITNGVHRTGDVMYDAVLRAREEAFERSTVLSELGLASGEYVLATVHRAKNTDDPARLAGILDGLASSTLPVVLPAHPRTVEALETHGLRERAEERLELVDPVGYLDFLRLVGSAARVATDSGGVQKEAFYLETPCVTLRERTEWIETVRAGGNVLVGADPGAIERALAAPADHQFQGQPYGDGDAARRIVEVIEDAV